MSDYSSQVTWPFGVNVAVHIFLVNILERMEKVVLMISIMVTCDVVYMGTKTQHNYAKADIADLVSLKLLKNCILQCFGVKYSPRPA